MTAGRTRRRVRLTAGIRSIVSVWMLWIPLLPGLQPDALAAALQEPAPGLKPAEVVQLQLAALRHNDRPGTDAGIATVFRFTSPRNRQLTGPLQRFAGMIHRGYAALIDHRSAVLGAIVVQGDDALQGVELIDRDGNAHRYVFVLSRQADAPYRGCWMTDSVLSAPDEKPGLTL